MKHEAGGAERAHNENQSDREAEVAVRDQAARRSRKQDCRDAGERGIEKIADGLYVCQAREIG